ncbi:CPBP family intramembrane glutamic endopeptidase [Weizmannia sp. FSL K6-0777]
MYITFTLVFLLSLSLSYIIRKYVRGNIFFRIMRIFLMPVPYLLIFLFIPFPLIDFNIDILYLIVVIFLSLAFILLDYKNLLNSNKRALFDFMPKMKGEQLISRFSEVSIVPIIEELFFRGFISLGASYPQLILSVIISSFLFSVAHYIGNDKSIKYHVKLCLFSITSVVIYLVSENLLYSIIFHILFNLPWFITNVRIYSYQKRKGEGRVAI